MEQSVMSAEERGWRRRNAAAVFLLLCFYMLCPVAPLRWAALYASYGKVFIVAVCAVYFHRRRLLGGAELGLVTAYALWLFITRLLNTDYYLEHELDLVISRCLCAVVFATAALLEPGDRKRLLDWLAAVLGGFYFVVSLLGIYAYFYGTYFYIPPENVSFGIDYSEYFYHLVLLQTNRTIFSGWLYIAWSLMLYELLSCRSKLWRIPIVIALFVFYAAIAMSFSRTTRLIVSLNLAMLLMLWALNRLRERRTALKALVCALILAVTVPLMYKSFELVIDGTAKLAALTGADVDRPSDEFIWDEYKGDTFDDPRSLTGELSTTAVRIEILKSFLPALRDDPIRILTGKYSDKLMLGAQKYMWYPYLHMHNFLLQTFMLTGLIGFLLVLAFTVLMVRRMIRLFFSSHPGASLAVKSLTFPVTGMFIYGMFDVLMFTGSFDERSMTTDIRELCFFLLAGAVLAYSRELCPDKRDSAVR